MVKNSKSEETTQQRSGPPTNRLVTNRLIPPLSRPPGGSKVIRKLVQLVGVAMGQAMAQLLHVRRVIVTSCDEDEGIGLGEGSDMRIRLQRYNIPTSKSGLFGVFTLR